MCFNEIANDLASVASYAYDAQSRELRGNYELRWNYGDTPVFTFCVAVPWSPLWTLIARSAAASAASTHIDTSSKRAPKPETDGWRVEVKGKGLKRVKTGVSP
jgi:hypothetical protein